MMPPLWVLAVLATAPDACALVSPDDPVIEDVRIAADTTRRHIGREVSISVQAPTATGINVLVYEDAPKPRCARPTDLPSVCRVERVEEARAVVRCSAKALRALDLAPGSPDPAILFVVAHEVAHVLLGHGGDFIDPTLVVDRATPVGSRLSKIIEGCTSREESVKAEEAADAEALRVLERAISEPAYTEEFVQPAARRTLFVGRLRQAAAELAAVSAPDSSAQLPEVLDSPRLPVDEAYVAWASERVLCDAVHAKKPLLVPLRNTTHPDAASRMAALSERLTGGTAAAGEREAGRPVSHLLSSLGSVFERIDADEAEFRAGLIPAMCTRARLARAQSPLDCGKVSKEPPPAPVECPVTSARFESRPLDAVRRRLPVERKGDRIVVPGRVVAASLRDDGAVLLGLHRPNGLVSIGANGAAEILPLPATPIAVAWRGSSLAALTENPFTWILEDGEGVRAHLPVATVVDGEEVDGRTLKPQWLGSVGDKWAAALLPGSGTSFNAVLGDGGFELPAAWRGPQCKELMTSLRLWPAGGSRVRATWASALGEALVADIPDLGREEITVSSFSDQQVRACVPHGKEFLCVRVDGRLVTIGSDGRARVRGTLDVDEHWKGVGMHASAEICSTRSAVFVLTRTLDGDGMISRLHRFDPGRRTAAVRVRGVGGIGAGLDCGPTEAVIYVSGADQTEIWKER